MAETLALISKSGAIALAFVVMKPYKYCIQYLECPPYGSNE
jgi:hypothetical protein